MNPQLSGIDHVHFYVTDRAAAAGWYRTTLGFRPVASLAAWAVPDGPLTIEDEAQRIHLALFERARPAPTKSIAFGTTGSDFLRWKTVLEGHDLALRLADHQLAYSLYFEDPWKNQLEITTYDRDVVHDALQARRDVRTFPGLAAALGPGSRGRARRRCRSPAS